MVSKIKEKKNWPLLESILRLEWYTFDYYQFECFRRYFNILQVGRFICYPRLGELLPEYQPSGAGGTRSPPATPYRLQHLTACLSKMADRVWKEVKPYVIWSSDQLLLNMFFDFLIPSIRTSKIQNGRQEAPKWQTGPGKVPSLCFWALWTTLAK